MQHLGKMSADTTDIELTICFSGKDDCWMATVVDFNRYKELPRSVQEALDDMIIRLDKERILALSLEKELAAQVQNSPHSG